MEFCISLGIYNLIIVLAIINPWGNIRYIGTYDLE